MPTITGEQIKESYDIINRIGGFILSFGPSISLDVRRPISRSRRMQYVLSDARVRKVEVDSDRDTETWVGGMGKRIEVNAKVSGPDACSMLRTLGFRPESEIDPVADAYEIRKRHKDVIGELVAAEREIGCAHYVKGEWAKALTAYQRIAALIDKDTHPILWLTAQTNVEHITEKLKIINNQ